MGSVVEGQRDFAARKSVPSDDPGRRKLCDRLGVDEATTWVEPYFTCSLFWLGCNPQDLSKVLIGLIIEPVAVDHSSEPGGRGFIKGNIGAIEVPQRRVFASEPPQRYSGSHKRARYGDLVESRHGVQHPDLMPLLLSSFHFNPIELR